MGELVELDVTTVEESVTVNVTEEGAVQVAVFAEKGDTGPNSVTSATTSDGTAELEVLLLTAAEGITANRGVNETSAIYADGGNGNAINATSETDAVIIASDNGTALTVTSNTGNDIAVFRDASQNGINIENPRGWLTWVYEPGEIYLGRLKTADITANREWTLPNASGTVALTEDYTAGTATIDVLNATVQGTLTADHIHGNLAGSVYAHIRAGENLAKGDPVYISGSHGSGANLIAIVSKANASNAATMPAVGVMDAAVANNTNGHMVIIGTITELNTNAFPVNTVLYVATGGGWTSTPPAANSQAVAIVERSNTNNGAVIVKVNGLATTGGNGAGDANKLVRYDSAGSFAIPGPYETDSDAAYAGVPVDHLYYQPSGAVAANVDIPSLDLAFAVDKSLTARFGPTPTFARASTGTYVGSNGLIESAAINEPRFDHDPVTGICRGLLIEESRQNALLNSAALATQNVTVTAAARTLSFYGTGTVVLSGTHVATVVGTGAFPARTTLTFTPTAGTLTLTVTGTVQYAQLEIGSFSTSYIPTTTTALTRSADVCSITGANFTSFYNQSEGTLFAVSSGNGVGRSAVMMNNGTNANQITIIRGNIGSLFDVASNGVYSSQISSAIVAQTIAKIAGSYGTNDARAAFNGVLGTADISVVVPTNLNRINIGSASAANTEQLNGHIARIQYFRKRLPNAKLQSLTT